MQCQLRRSLGIFLRVTAWALALAFVTQAAPRMLLLNNYSVLILRPLTVNNELFTICLKAITASRFTAAGGIIGVIYTPLALLILLCTYGRTIILVAVFDAIITIVVTAAVAVTAFYTPLDPNICQSITPQSAEAMTILYARLYDVAQGENGAAECIMTLAFFYVGLAAATLYGTVAIVTVVQAVTGASTNEKKSLEPLRSTTSDDVLRVPAVASPTAVTSLPQPEQSWSPPSHPNRCCIVPDCSRCVCSGQVSSLQRSSPTVGSEGQEVPPPPYEEHITSKKGMR